MFCLLISAMTVNECPFCCLIKAMVFAYLWFLMVVLLFIVAPGLGAEAVSSFIEDSVFQGMQNHGDIFLWLSANRNILIKMCYTKLMGLCEV